MQTYHRLNQNCPNVEITFSRNNFLSIYFKEAPEGLTKPKVPDGTFHFCESKKKKMYTTSMKSRLAIIDS